MEKNAVTLLNISQRIHAFFGETKQMSKSKKIATRREIDLELLQNILGHRSTRSLMSGETANVWKDIGLRIDTQSFPYHVRYLQ